jgi:hypothetical protein
MDRVVDFGLPGIVFLVLVIWLVRKVLRAARTERDLEGERLGGALAEELRAAKAVAAASRGPRLVTESPEPEATPEPASRPAPSSPLDGADLRGANRQHVQIVEALALEREHSLRAGHSGPTDVARRIEVLWVKSTATHAVWCERRNPATQAASAMTREVICVVKIENGKPSERWSY